MNLKTIGTLDSESSEKPNFELGRATRGILNVDNGSLKQKL